MFNITEIANKISKNGGNLYLVGGAVRDKLYGIQSHDEDYCVTGISTKEFERMFPNAIKRGNFFAVYDIDGREFAMARIERKNGNGHSDFEIETNSNVTIEEDLKRRDITINSIAQNVLTGEIIDPYGGMKDLENKVIKATSKFFKEDPLRAYRVARFASKFDFKVDNETIEMMREIKLNLKYLSVERVFDEFRKALNSKFPQRFFEILEQAEILEVHFEEIYKLIGVEQPKIYHPEGDAFNHTMLALKKASSLTEDEKIRFSVLVHDLGKALTPINEYPHHINHDVNGVGQVQLFCNRLKMPMQWKKCGMIAAKEHMRAGMYDKMTPAKKITFLENNYKTLLGLEGLEIVVESDRNCTDTKKEKIEFAKQGKEILEKINGKYIQEKYGELKPEQIKQYIHQRRIEYLKSLIRV